MKKALITSLLFVALISAANAQGHWQLIKTTTKIAPRSECSLVAVEGKLYLIGGDGPASPVEAYDPKTNTWAQRAMAPFTMHHLQAVGLGDKVYVLDAFTRAAIPTRYLCLMFTAMIPKKTAGKN